MTALQTPCIIFQTRHRMDDYGARDMRYGDLTADQLQHQYHLEQVSATIDPYRLKKRLPFTPSQYQFGTYYKSESDITLEQCARILFDEFRSESRLFSFYGPYRHLIIDMINHMQHANGAPFRHILLDMALKNKIINSTSTKSNIKIINTTLKSNINWKESTYPMEKISDFRDNISEGALPKFTSLLDAINGMALTVHDTWATQITISNLFVHDNFYNAKIHYKIQDHFGLDEQDILKYQTRNLSIIKTWFFLQRYNLLGFKPFMTNMEATIDISGRRNEERE